MNISSKMIKDDLDVIIASLKEEDVVIPTFWAACKPGLMVLSSIVCVQCIVLMLTPRVNSGDFYFSLFFSVFIGLLMFFGIMSASGSYKSLPYRVRKQSVIIRMLNEKIKSYVIAWALMVILAGITTVMMGLPPVAVSGATFVSMILLYFLFSADMSRYNLSGLSAAISVWRSESQK